MEKVISKIPNPMRLAQALFLKNFGSRRIIAARIIETGIEAWRTALTAAASAPS